MAVDRQTVREPARETPVLRRTGVLVVGGGPAGLAAAVSAARSGADVTLVERYGQLGGLAAGGLIILLLTLDDGRGRQVIAGLCQEMVDRLAARGAAVFPPEGERYSADPALVEKWARWGLRWGRGPHHVRYSVAYDPHEFMFVADDLVRETGIHLLLHTWGTEPIIEPGAAGAPARVRGVFVQSKAGRGAILAEVVVDTTGDGDLAFQAGLPMARERVLPWLWFRVAGAREPDGRPFEGSAEEGDIRYFRTPGEGMALMAPWGGYGPVARAIDPTDPEELTWGELACRDKVREVLGRTRAERPGFERAVLAQIATQLGITESRRLEGVHILTAAEADRPFPDAIARTGHWSKYDQHFDVPYRSLLPRDLDGLLVAGRCISVDHRVHSATKEIPCCFATGEAAGVAAAMALEAGVAPRAVEVGRLQGVLRGRGALVPDAQGRL